MTMNKHKPIMIKDFPPPVTDWEALIATKALLFQFGWKQKFWNEQRSDASCISGPLWMALGGYQFSDLSELPVLCNIMTTGVRDCLYAAVPVSVSKSWINDLDFYWHFIDYVNQMQKIEEVIALLDSAIELAEGK